MPTLTQTAPPPQALGRQPGMRLFDPGGGRSLDQLVTALRRAAAAGEPAECLVCGAAVSAPPDEPVECSSCGSVLE